MFPFQVFGAIVGGSADGIGFPLGSGQDTVDLEGTVMPYLTAFADFREGVRKIAREHKGELSLSCYPIFFMTMTCYR